MLKSTHKAIKEFYARRTDLLRQGVSHEMGLRAAFQGLLAATGSEFKWTLIAEETLPGKRIRPDGTFRDGNYLPRGYWESKDPGDVLDREIEKKREKGYPSDNIIYEDSRQAVLIQDQREVMRADVERVAELVNLLNAFYRHTPPAIEDFERAVEEFKERVPELARGLLAKIEEAKSKNRRFQAAFADFFELCKRSLNPNLSEAAVEEMLVQHLLSERLIRTVFDNPEFTRRNVIACEVEKVIDALMESAYSRQEYLKSLDRFYVAIEGAARTLPEFSDKQHFMNTVYERFFQGYSVKIADTHGIVYTPQPIVDFMCASVEEVLKSEFGKTLGDKDVFIIDPCTGTGNFIVNLVGRIPKQDLPRMFRQQLFANEVMLMPYYIAALNIEHAYYEQTGEYEPFEGLCFVDTLDLAEARQGGLFTEKNLERVERQRRSPITVVIGNPPYNMGQVNENDNNKNRKYEHVDQRVQDTYTRDSKATLRNKLSDAYVRFFRWASDRLGDRPGIVTFVSNNGFLDGIAFDGFRKHVAKDFDTIYHFDFKGNARTSGEQRRREGGNIFEDKIRVGVGITVLVRKKHRAGQPSIFYHAVGDYWKYEQKAGYLRSFAHVGKVPWQELHPDARHNWLVAEHADEWAGLMPIGSKEAKAAKEKDARTVFNMYSPGVKTNRDYTTFSFSKTDLLKNVRAIGHAYNAEVDRYKRAGMPEAIDDFVDYRSVDWSSGLKAALKQGAYFRENKERVIPSFFRPFSATHLYYEKPLVDRPGLFGVIFPAATSRRENRVIVTTGAGASKPFHLMVVDRHVCYDFIEKTQCFPFYVYNEDGTGRRENITDWAVERFKEKYEIRNEKLEKKKRTTSLTLPRERREIKKWDIFYYVYGLLHHPGYRERFADNLKRELPRIPFAPDFWAFSEAGKKLAELHLNYESAKPIWEVRGSKCKRVIDPKKRLNWRVEKMRLVKPKDEGGRMKDEPAELHVNDSISVIGIPPEAFEYRLGNRSALEWVVEQYQVKEDKRSGIVSDPNRADDPEYIVRLVGQVIAVSLETVKIVKGLPKEFMQPPPR